MEGEFAADPYEQVSLVQNASGRASSAAAIGYRGRALLKAVMILLTLVVVTVTQGSRDMQGNYASKAVVGGQLSIKSMAAVSLPSNCSLHCPAINAWPSNILEKKCSDPVPCPICPALPKEPLLQEQRKGRQGLWEDPGYHYRPYEDMFVPFDSVPPKWRSLVLFTAGRSGMENVDRLVTQWGTQAFDYVIMHFDNSSSEWNKFEWYRQSVGITALDQAKMWYFKRFASPWAVKGYRYTHFVDSDAGSPQEQPFNLLSYDHLLHEHKVMIGQPAVAPSGRSSDHSICRVQPNSLLRWTTFVENGPLYSVAQEAFECYWGMLAPNLVSGWGPDTIWCPYLTEVCGFPEEGACAVVDAYYITHLDKKTASGATYRGKTYADYGYADWAEYRGKVESSMKKKSERREIKKVPSTEWRASSHEEAEPSREQGG